MPKRVFTLAFLLQSFFLAVVYANTLTITEQGHILAETENYTARLEKGSLVYFHNKLTQETYTRDDVVPKNETVFYTTTAGIWAASEPVINAISPTSVEIVYERDLRFHIFIEIDLSTGDLLIRQEGFSPDGGAQELWWTLKNLSHSEVAFIAPCRGGIILNGEIPYSRYNYPGDWEAQFVILQGQRGGVFVRSEDIEFVFKDLIYQSDSDSFRLNFISIAFAPFKDQTHLASATWRLNAYQGDWEVPAQSYQQWMEASFPIFDRQQTPAWVDDIEFVVKNQDELDLRILSRLAQLVDPKTTLIYLYNWRQDESGGDFPFSDDATNPELQAFIALAHRYGFKVKPHISLLGLREANPLYARFEKYQARSPYTNERMGWRWNDPTYHRPAYINPASQDVRRVFVSEVKWVWDIYSFDAVQLDMSTLTINDNNGLIDGLRWAEGKDRLHQELREVIPNIVMTAEHVNERIFSYYDFADFWTVQHPYPHPITTFLFSPYVRLFGFLPNEPDEGTELFQEYFDLSQEYGFLPTLLIWDVHGLDDSKVETHKLLALVRERQNYVFGDVNGDLTVNILDLVLISQALGNDQVVDTVLDVNKDGVVNILDLVIVSQNL